MDSKKVVLGLLISIGANNISFAQITTSQLKGGDINAITTAVPLLLISPDSRAGAMGECGVATSPDINSMHWNAAKYSFIDKKLGVSASYSPWLRQLVPDISLAYLAGYGKLDKNSAIAGSLRYFSLGNITFTDITGNTTGNFKPNEFAVDIGYTRKLGERFSAAMALRYVNSNLTGGVNVNGSNTHAGQAVAVDVSGYYANDDIKISGKKSTLSAGFNISNIGNKMSYTDNASPDSKNFLPMNMKLGSCLKINPDEFNSFAFTVDINKLLVPTPPVYERDSNGNIEVDPNTGEKVIASGKDPQRGVAAGLFGSFADAPGGFKEEMKEIIIQTGVEYWYDKLFAVRAGYFHEDKTKGGRQFFTMGVGVKYNVFGFDFAYLIPTVPRNNPLQNTLRFSLSFDFDAFNKQNKEGSGDSQ